LSNFVRYRKNFGQHYIYIAATSEQKPHTRSTAGKTRKRTPVEKAKAEVLAPIYAIGNRKLIAIAEDKFYRANTLRAVLKPFRSFAGIEQGLVASLVPHKRHGERQLGDDASQRSEIRHLEIKAFLNCWNRYLHPAKIEEFGQPEAKLLKKVPKMYPKLRSLRFELCYDVTQKYCTLGENECFRGQIYFLPNTLRALQAIKRGNGHDQVSFRFKHSLDPAWGREAAEIEGLEVDADVLAQQVLDLPEVVVKFCRTVAEHA